MNDDIRGRLLGLTGKAVEYCSIIENCVEMVKGEFISAMTLQLPQIYVEFITLDPEETGVEDYGYYNATVSEEWYESVRANIARLLGEDDVYLETVEENMKYSDTPIAVSISEGLADIYQALANYVSIVNESDGAEMPGAYTECRESFAEYWAQTLCNTLRALNNLRFGY